MAPSAAAASSLWSLPPAAVAATLLAALLATAWWWWLYRTAAQRKQQHPPASSGDHGSSNGGKLTRSSPSSAATALLPLPPGPRNWPLLGALPSLPRDQLPHVAFTALARRYGPVVHLRLGTTPFLLLSDAAAARQALQEQDAEFASRPYSTCAAEYGFQGLVMARGAAEWRARRRVVNVHLLAPEVVQGLEPVRAREVARCVRAVHRAWRAGAAVSVPDLLHALTTNVVSAMTLSKAYLGYPGEDEEQVEEQQAGGGGGSRQMEMFKEAGKEGTRLFAAMCIGDIIPALRPLDLGGVARAFRALHAVQDAWLDAVLADRKEPTSSPATTTPPSSPRRHHDFLEALLTLQRAGEISDGDLRSSVFEIQIAGAETVAASAHWAFAELLRHPPLLARAQAEVRAVVPPATRQGVRESDLPALPFLRAVVHETWRLHPPVPLGLPHHNPAETSLLGYRVPARSTVLVNAYAIGRDPAAWPDRPDLFLPDRFLPPAGAHQGVDATGSHQFLLLPFSAGRRRCPGMHLGAALVMLTLASLLHAFDWALPPGVRPQDLDMAEAAGLVLNRAVPCVAVPTACTLPDPSVYDLD